MAQPMRAPPYAYPPGAQQPWGPTVTVQFLGGKASPGHSGWGSHPMEFSSLLCTIWHCLGLGCFSSSQDQISPPPAWVALLNWPDEKLAYPWRTMYAQPEEGLDCPHDMQILGRQVPVLFLFCSKMQYVLCGAFAKILGLAVLRYLRFNLV